MAKIHKMVKKVIPIIFLLIIIPTITASPQDDILKLHGYLQDGLGIFLTGTYTFNFTLFDKNDSSIIFSNSTDLTTTEFGEWLYDLNISGYDRTLFENGTARLLNITVDTSATVSNGNFGYVPYAYYCKYPSDEYMIKTKGTQNIGELYYNIIDTLLTTASGTTKLNLTTTNYNGSCTFGSDTGYTACDKICDAYESGSYLCSAEDINTIRRSLSHNLSTLPDWTGEAWINDWGQKYSPATVPMNDCNGHKWGVSGSYLGSWWRFNTTTGGDPKAGHCGNTFPLACCS